MDYYDRVKMKIRLEELENLGAGSDNTGEIADGTWKLLWTSEQEINFILFTAFLFFTQCGDIFQVIDSQQGRLQNVILFPPKGSLIVDGETFVADSQQVDFEFIKAAFTAWGITIPLPPRGEGWFKIVYVDDKVKVSKDIREDWSISIRDGPVRYFN